VTPLGGIQLICCMRKTCPHCGESIGAPGHDRYGLQKLEKGWVELGLPIVGKANIRREAVAMVYICSKANLPFLVVLPESW
jgi:hypothetical protein